MQLLLGVSSRLGFGIRLSQQRIDPSPVGFEFGNDSWNVCKRGTEEFVPQPLGLQPSINLIASPAQEYQHRGEGKPSNPMHPPCPLHHLALRLGPVLLLGQQP